MRQLVRNIAPFINVDFYVTSPWWTVRDGVIHRGLDISTGKNDSVYSILDGVVHSKGYDNSMGNWIIIYDNVPSSSTYGYATLYMHLKQLPIYSIGARVNKGTEVGIEGTTGDSTGIHLHVEMQNINRFNKQWHWSYEKSDYIDPASYMGINNIKDSTNSWYYGGTPVPPYETKDKRKFKFVLYANKIRNRANF